MANKVLTGAQAFRNCVPLNTELQDVQTTMFQNIDDVLQRQVVLSGNMKIFLMSQSTADSLLHGNITF